MEFIQHTNNWVKGEIFEAILYGSFGLLTVICSFILIKFGETPNAKALTVPLVFVGLFFVGTAVFNILNNKGRLEHYKVAHSFDRASFIKSEKLRVEEFQKLYKMTLAISAFCFALALCAFLFTDNQYLKAVGLSLIIFGLTGLVIDYFSKERADVYYEEIIKRI